MPEPVQMLAALMAGVAAGLIVFGGLWLTIRFGLESRRPNLVFGVSFGLRMAVGLFLLGAAGGSSGPAWAAALIGVAGVKACLVGSVAWWPAVSPGIDRTS